MSCKSTTQLFNRLTISHLGKKVHFYTCYGDRKTDKFLYVTWVGVKPKCTRIWMLYASTIPGRFYSDSTSPPQPCSCPDVMNKLDYPFGAAKSLAVSSDVPTFYTLPIIDAAMPLR